MGTSNWQNIPFCVEVLMKIAPRRVLDVGVGFGRWGIIVREFCENWYGRELQKDWEIYIEGIEAFPKCITDYHHQFYDKIHIGDAAEIVPTLEGQWDVIIFGDVLEHFTKEDGLKLLNYSLNISDYVMVNVPLGHEWLQDEKYNNPYERHLSKWTAEEFQTFALRRQGLFLDYIGRPFGSFVLSKHDPQKLAVSLFSQSANPDRQVLISGEVTTELDLQEAFFRLQQAQADLQQARSELEAIKNSKTWRLARKILDSPLGTLLRSMKTIVESQPIEESVQTPGESSPGPSPLQPLPEEQARFSPEEMEWLEQVHTLKPEAVAITHPDWKGVRSAAVNLFPVVRFVDDTLDDKRAKHLAQLLAETDCQRFVFSGFALSHQHLVTALHNIIPQAKIYVVWHGSFLQSSEDYAWQTFRLLQGLCKEGLISKWGFAKKGMAEVMARTGLCTGFVMNFVKEIPSGPSTPMAGGPHLGIWTLGTTWRKLPYAMLAASSMIPGACVHGSGASERVREFAKVMNVNATLQGEPLPQELMPSVLSQMHLNMYVTLSECAPMLPLESLSVGAPCLFGPNSHLFEDHPFLHQSLVVPYPDRAMVIAEYANKALANRDEIVKAYIEYAPGYNERAKRSLAEFLEI